MKNCFLLLLLLCAVMLFGGCRAGGADTSGGYLTDLRVGKFDIGESTDKSDVYSQGFSSDTVSSSSRQSTSSDQSSSDHTESVESDVSSSASAIAVIQSTQTVQSTKSFQSSVSEVPAISSRSPKSNSAPIVSTAPEESLESSSLAAIEPNAPVDDDTSAVDSRLNEHDDPAASEPEVSSFEPIRSLPETSVSQHDEETVYVAASGKGKKYHKNPKCSNMNGTRALTVEEALEEGYTPCKKCW